MSVLQTSIGSIDLFEHGFGDNLCLLLHASATGPHALGRLAGRLAMHDRRVIAPAFVGYASTAMAGEMPIDRIAANRSIVSELFKVQPAKKRVLFGHSMGGLIALLVAQEATRGGWPIDAVVLYDPILVGLLDQHKPDQSQARIWDQGVIEQLSNHVAAGNAEAGVRHFVEAWNETSWTALPAPARSQLIANAANLVTETTAVSTYSISRPDLAAFKTPVLLLQGERSPPIVGCMIDEALLVLPNAVRTKLPACGHMGPLLRPDIIAEAANAFLQGILN